MKKIVSLVAIGATLLMLGACSTKVEVTPATDKTVPMTGTTPDTTADTAAPTALVGNIYENKEAGFSLQVPSTWTAEENVYNSLVMLFTPQTTGDEFRENVGVMTEDLPYEITLDEYYEAAKQNLLSIVEGYTESVKENVTVNGLEGMKIVYQGKTSGYELKREQVYFIKGKKTYILTYTASPDTFDQYSKDVDTIMNSFTLK